MLCSKLIIHSSVLALQQHKNSVHWNEPCIVWPYRPTVAVTCMCRTNNFAQVLQCSDAHIDHIIIFIIY